MAGYKPAGPSPPFFLAPGRRACFNWAATAIVHYKSRLWPGLPASDTRHAPSLPDPAAPRARPRAPGPGADSRRVRQRHQRQGTADPHRRDQQLQGDSRLPRPVQEGLAAGAGGSQRVRRRAGPQARGVLARRQRQPRRFGARRPGTAGARKGGLAVRRLPVQHRPGADRFRQAAAGVLPGRRAADRQDHLAGRQPLHVPPAAVHLDARGRAGAQGAGAAQEALGHRLPQLRVRTIGRGHLQGHDEVVPVRRRIRRRAGRAAGQGRRRRGGPGPGRRQA